MSKNLKRIKDEPEKDNANQVDIIAFWRPII